MAIQGLLARVEKLEEASGIGQQADPAIVVSYWDAFQGTALPQGELYGYQSRECDTLREDGESVEALLERAKNAAPAGIKVLYELRKPSPEAEAIKARGIPPQQPRPQRIEDRPAEPVKPKGNRMLPSDGSLDILRN